MFIELTPKNMNELSICESTLSSEPWYLQYMVTQKELRMCGAMLTV